MGLFNNLMSKIFGSSSNSAPATTGTPGIQPATGAPVASSTVAVASAGAPATFPSATPTVDVGAVLDGMAAKNPEKLDWKRSIVDLMKLVGMDSSLASRKQLATELNYSGDQGDSATMNIWLHKQVLKKLSENGGKVPADLLR